MQKKLYTSAVSQPLGGSVKQIFEADNPQDLRFWAIKQLISILFYYLNAYSLHANLCYGVS